MCRSEKQRLEEELELYQLQWKAMRELAEELVRDRGWSEKDDDFLFQVEQEARHLWDEELDRQQARHMPYEEATCDFSDTELL